jgi:hypothetical protein
MGVNKTPYYDERTWITSVSKQGTPNNIQRWKE